MDKVDIEKVIDYSNTLKENENWKWEKELLIKRDIRHQKEIEELENRIDKAREYIENTYIGSILEVHSGYEEEYTKPLLDILKGSDKE